MEEARQILVLPVLCRGACGVEGGGMIEESEFAFGGAAASVFWLVVWLFVSLSHEASDKTKDRVLADCVGRGGTYAQCLSTWEGRQ